MFLTVALETSPPIFMATVFELTGMTLETYSVTICPKTAISLSSLLFVFTVFIASFNLALNILEC
jgi:hypothetical protein